MSRVGVVAIGRNEGKRLQACLASLQGYLVTYVDSGSTDGSQAMAQEYGAKVVELDMSQPFSAARARNAGLIELRKTVPSIEFVQFIDGDCVIVEDWIETAYRFLDENPQYAVVCGRRREMSPNTSIYNKLCDMEWDTPPGDAVACGGDALMRVAALEESGPFNHRIIAGEEPELCERLRNAGWKIRRLSTEMSLHDASMTTFSQWWKRSVRTGYGASLCSTEYGLAGFRRIARSAMVWGIAVPLAVLVLAPFTYGLCLLLLASYPVLCLRAYRYARERQFSLTDSRLYAFFCVLGKFPQAQGVLRFWWGKLRSKPSEIIEYKNPVVTGP